MSDHVWDDEAAPAFDAAAWVLDQLTTKLRELALTKMSEHKEFEDAVDSLDHLADDLADIRNNCYLQREGERGDDDDYEDEPGAASEWGVDPERAPDVDIQKIMKEQGLKDVDGTHYKEEAYTGVKHYGMITHEIDIGDYLDGRESWEDVIARAIRLDNMGMYPIRDLKGPVMCRRVTGVRKYRFLYFDPRVNLMSEFIFFEEERQTRDGSSIKIVARWRGLKYPGSPGILHVFKEDGAVHTQKDCTHISQMISLLDNLPPDGTADDIHELWYPRRTLAEMIGAENLKKEVSK